MTRVEELELPRLDYTDPQLRGARFHTAMREDPPGPDYSDKSKIVSGTHQWMYRLGDIVSALAATGLRIEYLHEFPGCIYQHFPFMTQASDRSWHIEGDPIPTIFSIKASKP